MRKQGIFSQFEWRWHPNRAKFLFHALTDPEAPRPILSLHTGCNDPPPLLYTQNDCCSLVLELDQLQVTSSLGEALIHPDGPKHLTSLHFDSEDDLGTICAALINPEGPKGIKSITGAQ